ncbi:hypothetical protein [Sphingobium cloacae]|uniref:Tetratricopeptide repeat protein n=1 Tax=Sphingobium cloacae TaxID=120107 RepID=A0A1E1F135_9SPHN|nr:hypothetical protein [Sphingobium cloacae]BAV64172.1 hypothetical protein SCLO_1011320 [Sphingobium cloacae]
MLKVAAVIGLALAATAPGIALAAPDEVLVVGVPDGGLAANALMSGDFGKAANKLKSPVPDGANDPARLINLGNAYAGLGRMADARDAYKAARFAPETLLVLANGKEESSRDIARRAMGKLATNYAMR